MKKNEWPRRTDKKRRTLNKQQTTPTSFIKQSWYLIKLSYTYTNKVKFIVSCITVVNSHIEAHKATCYTSPRQASHLSFFLLVSMNQMTNAFHTRISAHHIVPRSCKYIQMWNRSTILIWLFIIYCTVSVFCEWMQPIPRIAKSNHIRQRHIR